MKKICLAVSLFLLFCSAAYAAELRLPQSLKAIEAQAFYGDAALTEVIVPEGVETIGDEAFAESGLQRISLPASLRDIAWNAFRGCEGLQITAPLGSYACAWAAERDLLAPECYPDQTLITLPDTLPAGADLTVRLTGPADAVWHTVFLIDSAGKNKTQTLRGKGGQVSWRGYDLEPGNYRLVIYTVTEDYSTLPAITRALTIAGEKLPGPVLELPETVRQNTETTVSLGKKIYVRAYRYESDGTLVYDTVDWFEPDESFWIDTWASDGIEGGYWEYSASEYRDGVWTAWGPVARVTIVPLPQLDAPEIDLPDTVPAGRDLTFSFSGVENAATYFVNIYDEANNHIIGQNYNKGSTASIPGYYLSAGQYRLILHVEPDNENFRSIDVERFFTVSGSRPEIPVITPERDYIYTSADKVPIHIYAPGAQCGEVWCYEPSKNGNSQGGAYIFHFIVNENGEALFDAEFLWNQDAQYDNWYLIYRIAVIADDTWSPWSEPIKLLIKQREPLAKAAIDAPTSVQAGNDFTFSFAPVEHADEYRANLTRKYDYQSIYWWNSQDVQPNMPLSLPGYYLPNGSYRLTVTAISKEYGESTSEVVFSVSGSRSPAPVAVLEDEAVYANKQFTFAVDTKDAQQLAMRYYQGSETNSSNYSLLTVDGETTRWSNNPWSSAGQTWHYSFSVRKDGAWSSWSSPIEFVVQPQPQLAAPVIYAESSYVAGEDFTISFDAVEHAESYRCALYTGNNQHLMSSEYTEAASIDFYGYQLEPGSYKFTVRAEAEDYGTAAAEHTFTVTPSPLPAPEVSVDRDHVDAYESFTFTIDTAFVEELRYKTSTNTLGAEVINVLNDVTQWTTSSDSSGVREYRFSALIDGRWTAWSNPIVITIQAVEPLPGPAFTLPENLFAGQDLTVTVDDIPGASYYNVYLFNGRGTRLDNRYISNGNGCTVTFSGYHIAAGVVKVTVETWGRNSMRQTTLSLRVAADDRPDAPQATPESNTVAAGKYARFTLDTAGAEQAAARYYQVGYPNNVSYQNITVSSDSTDWQQKMSNSGNTYAFSFAVKKDGVWSPWTEATEIAVVPQPQLAAPVIHAESSYVAGEDFAISFDAVEHGESYRCALYTGNNQHLMSSEYTEAASIDFYGYQLEPGSYKFTVRVYAEDYGTASAEHTFTVTPSPLPAPEVSVDRDHANVNENYTFTIDTTGAEELRCKTSNQGFYSEAINVLSDTTQWTTYSFSSGSKEYRFSALIDGHWTAWSEPITITVRETAPLPAPVFTLPESLTAGQDLSVTVEAVPGASAYSVYLLNGRGAQLASRSIDSAAGGEATFMGYRIAAGVVKVRVEAQAPGASSQATLSLRVAAGDRPDAPQVTPESDTVTSGNYARFTLDTAGAEQAAARYYRVGYPNDVRYESISIKGDSTAWSCYLFGSDSTYAFSFAVKKGGVWSPWGGAEKIIVE